jgi:hypothetical protein
MRGSPAGADQGYTYVPVPGGMPVTVTRKLDGRVQMRPGQRVLIRYLASHPTVSLLVGQEDRHNARDGCGHRQRNSQVIR